MKEKSIAELMYLVMLVNFKTDYCVFVDYQAHVSQIGIRVRKSKKEWDKEIAHSDLYADRPDFEKRATNIRKVLTDILDNEKINYDLCDIHEWVETHREYVF